MPPSSIVWFVIVEITGASLTAVTVNVKLPLSLICPSLTVTATIISPLKSVAGVTVNVEP